MNPSARATALRELVAEPFDLLIIGGGIVGAGVARDGAMRGLRVALIDQHDFAFGTSSRSSRLLHGGLRYLAQGRLGLVRQASHEKKILHRIAPHLAEPLPFFFPSYRGQPDWALWKLRIGVKLYDLLCGGENFGRSRAFSRDEAAQHVPGLNADRLAGAVRYFDALTNDARLVLDTLRSAARAGAVSLNYVRFANATRSGDVWQCALVDQLESGPLNARARCVVNATGPWADGLPHSRVKLRLTKGIHIVLDRERLPVPDAVVMTEGKRILFAIPWAERVIVGTTDADYRGSLDDVRVEPKEIEEVLGVANRFFPNAGLAGVDVICAWAGLRPLIADPNGKPSEISRAHQIRSPEHGWWDVAGGKLTTYRRMAEETVDRVFESLNSAGALSLAVKPCCTAIEPLLPASETKGLSGIAPPEFSKWIVEHGCTHEWAVHLSDVMIRRTGWHQFHLDAAGKAKQVAEWMAEPLDWTPAMREDELADYLTLVEGSRPK